MCFAPRQPTEPYQSLVTRIWRATPLSHKGIVSLPSMFALMWYTVFYINWAEPFDHVRNAAYAKRVHSADRWAVRVVLVPPLCKASIY